MKQVTVDIFIENRKRRAEIFDDVYSDHNDSSCLVYPRFSCTESRVRFEAWMGMSF